ncbi:septum site-determining protein Ssd [Nocardioides campestrisoli]|uniref:septum site-determining protein Ssd n=1 Tax=Nocardioides campestrisoli TaxID=2736757 RepID=UPI0015E6F1C3|nr:septum site-determining protein Ssd [Nocardioides campestrisoli]
MAETGAQSDADAGRDAGAGGLLVVSRDPRLVEEVHRLAAGAGVMPRVAGGEAAALAEWPGASVVLVGFDLAGRLALLRPPRRPGVHLVGCADPEEGEFRRAVELGAEAVLRVDQAGDWLAGLMSDLVVARRRGRVLAVQAGSGGAGATTLACALAQVAVRSGPALVVDTDPGGPGVDRVLGLDGEPGLGWSALAGATGRLSGVSLRDAVPGRDGLGVLTWGPGTPVPPAPEVVREALAAARRVHDLVVVDLPRRSGELVEEVVTRADRLLVVLRPTLTSVAATARVLEGRGDRAALVLRGRGLSPGSVERTVGAPVLVQMLDQRGLEEAVELGLGPARGRRGPLARAAAELLAGLGEPWAA